MATVIARKKPRERADGFYLGYAIAFSAIAFLGFAPTYWMRMAAGTFHAAPIYHVHGMLFFGWTLFYLAQTWLVRAGRTPDHRSWGMAGIALFSVMACSIVVTQITTMKARDMDGFGDAGRHFAAVSLLGLVDLCAIFALAIATVKRPETHKRLMMLLMAQLMIPAIARVFITLLAPGGGAGPPPPPLVTMPPHLVGDLLLIPAMIRDRRSIGHIHTVYRYGLPLIVVAQIAELGFGSSAAWLPIARAIEGLTG